MLVIAHRGACMEALENSFAAFDLALLQGAQRFEFDIQVSRDGQAVVIHDEDLKRTASRSGAIARMTRKEIEQVQLRNGEKIPFLDEVLDKYSGKVEFNIELKGNNPAVADSVAQVLESYKSIYDDIIISSFKHHPLERMRELRPDIKIACLWGPDIEWPFFGRTDPLRFMDMMGASILHPWIKYVNESLMEMAKARGWQVFAYADRKSEAKDPEKMWSELRRLGVDGLCTNWPEKLRIWVAKMDYFEAQEEHE